MKNIIKLSLSLAVICALMSLLIGGANEITAPIIATRKIESAENARKELIIGADAFERLDYTDETVKEVYTALKAGEIIGYTVEVNTSGYGGIIDMIVGVNTAGEVLGISYISMSETAGLGEKTKDQRFYGQYIGVKGPFSVVKSSPSSDTDIVAVSGATISSKAVTAGVNSAIQFVKEYGVSK